jgi:UDP-N-acetylglucosamine acyltransferase
MNNVYQRNYFHPTIEVSNVSEENIGEGNYFGPYCTFYPGVKIGNRNRFEGYCSIGSPAEKHGYFIPSNNVPTTLIGDDNIIREFTTINSGSRRSTVMGNKCLMLRGSHLSHDSILENEVTVSCSVMIGGESYIMTGCNLGLGSLLHQFSVMGSYSMLGMGTVVTKTTNLQPGYIYIGNPARELKPNIIGLTRKNITDSQLLIELSRWEDLKATNKD